MSTTHQSNKKSHRGPSSEPTGHTVPDTASSGGVPTLGVIAFGDYTGGQLVMDGKLVDIKNRFITADFSAITHSVNPILTGDRFSMVFFKSPIAVDLPPPSVRLENGKWFFYRGTEKVYYDKWRNSSQYKNNQEKKKNLL
jgi:hypothetical protein